MKHFFILLLLAFFKYSLAVDIEDQVCGCSGNNCCILDEISFTASNVFSTGTDNDYVQTLDYGNFSRVVTNAGVLKQNLNILSLADIDCTQTIGFLFENGGSDVPIAQTTFTQSGPRSCVLNFTGLVSDEDLRLDLDLALAFNSLFDTVTLNFQESIVPYTLPVHRWVIEEKQGDDSVVTVDLNIQWFTLSNHNDSCLATANLDGVHYQFTVAGSAPGSASECNFQTDSIIINEGNGTAHIEFDFEQADYIRCYRQAPENVGNDVVFTYEVRPVIDGCDYYDSYNSHVFTITADNLLQVNNTANVNSMILDLEQDTIEIVPCAAEYDDINPLVPLAKIRFYVTVDTSYGTEATSVVLTTLEIEDIQLEQIGVTNLTSLAGSNTRARFLLQTTECMFVDTEHSGEPESQANLLSCSIDYLQPASIIALATYQDGFTESNDVANDDRNVVFESSSIADCAGIIVPVNDVTREYGAVLIVEDLNGRTDSLNLNNPIIARVELTNAALAESSGVSVVLNDLIIDLDNEYVRTFTVTNKIQQMQYEFSPYYADGHFCRYFESANSTCERFYQQTAIEAEYEEEHWNANFQTLYDVGTSGFFITDGSGRKYEGCQAATSTSSDSFVFTPSDWVYKNFPRRFGTMHFQATAYLRACTPGGSRRLREVKLVGTIDNRNIADALSTDSRELQNNGDVAIVFNNVTIINSDVIIVTGGDNGGNANLLSANFGLMVALIVIVSVGFLGLCCCTFCGLGGFKKRLRKTFNLEDSEYL